MVLKIEAERVQSFDVMQTSVNKMLDACNNLYHHDQYPPSLMLVGFEGKDGAFNINAATISINNNNNFNLIEFKDSSIPNIILTKNSNDEHNTNDLMNADDAASKTIINRTNDGDYKFCIQRMKDDIVDIIKYSVSHGLSCAYFNFTHYFSHNFKYYNSDMSGPHKQEINEWLKKKQYSVSLLLDGDIIKISWHNLL